jgi:hypothetical protein
MKSKNKEKNYLKVNVSFDDIIEASVFGNPKPKPKVKKQKPKQDEKKEKALPI